MKKILVYIVIALIGIVIFLLQFGYGKKYEPIILYQVYLDNEIIGIIDSKEELDNYIAQQGKVVKEKVVEYSTDVEIIKTIDTIMKKVITNNNPYYNEYSNLLTISNAYININKLVENDGKIIDNYEKVEELYNSYSKKYIEGTSLNKNKIENYEKLKSNFDNEINPLRKKMIDYIYNSRNSLNLTTNEINKLESYKNSKLYDIDYSKYVYMSDYVEDNSIYLSMDNIYQPLGINIRRIATYKDDSIDEKEVYDKILEKKPCTIEGYQFKIRKSKSVALTDTALLGAIAHDDYEKVSENITEDIIVYVTNPKVFNEAIDEITSVFVGSEQYTAYKDNKQKEIEDTGSKVENVYLKEQITIRESNISVKEKIFDDGDKLASYLLYGENDQIKTVYASSNQSILDLAYDNEISIEEFFLSNPTFTGVNNMFYDNQPVTIRKTNPKLSVVVEETTVEDKNIEYKVIEKYDDEMIKGDKKVTQKGEQGLMRVNQKVQKVNGAISHIKLQSKETIKDAQDQIVLVGTKEIPNVGSTTSWGWPTNSGYTLTSYFGWRAYPFNPSARELHAGLDIAGTGYGSPIYASNNGTIEIMRRDRWNYGTHIIINHNNGYWTTYGHMSGFVSGLKVGDTVSRGQQIGYMGSTGAATGTHLHFEIRVGANRYANVTDPLPYLRKK